MGRVFGLLVGCLLCCQLGAPGVVAAASAPAQQEYTLAVFPFLPTSAPAVRVFESQLGLKLQRIGRSQAIPHVLFAVHRRVPPADCEKIRTVLLASLAPWLKKP